MPDRSKTLRQRIELYRGYLRHGVDDVLALEYLRQIAEDEAELAKIDRPPADRSIAAIGIDEG